ncbi:hypothetical protein B5S31_g2798 [[Candida] boidinii]|nr:hypothetical protein B5S31_g2798 [[Candida] boidinii]
MESRRRYSFSRKQRSNSMVQSIALNIPIISNQLNIDSQHLSLRRRSNSFNSSKLIEHAEKSDELENNFTFPLTYNEKKELWRKKLEEFESDYVISAEDQNEMNDIENVEYFKFQEFIKETLKEHSSFFSETSSLIDDLNKLKVINSQVSSETSDFQNKSSELITKVEQLSSLHNELSETLKIFESLDGIVKSLNLSSSGAIVAKESFREDILFKLDKCLAFVNNENYKNYKDIEIYRYRFSQCMTRALSLIRNYVTNFIKNIESKLQTKINEAKKNSNNDENSTSYKIMLEAFINNQFDEDCQVLQPLIEELYIRCADNDNETDDLNGLLVDCYNTYFKTRQNLLTQVIQPHITASSLVSINGSTSKNLVQAAQSNITYFIKLMDKEYKIFSHIFFSKNPMIDETYNVDALNKWFESLIEPLYDLLRNKIIRETNIGELCELITTLQNYIENEESLDYLDTASKISDGQSSVLGPMYRGNNQETGFKKISLESLLTPILQDTQSRLVFRVQNYVDKNIVTYKKTGNELVIENRKRRSTNEKANTSTTSIANDDLELGDTTEGEIVPSEVKGIYPPIIKSIRLLSKIYQLLNQTVFDDLANSVVHLFLLSLRDNFGKVNGVEAKLYQIKNLIFFKDYISTYDIEHVRRETNLDFSGIQKLFRRFYHGSRDKQTTEQTYGGALAPEDDGFLSLMLGTIPKVVNDYVDAKYELQMALRNAVHEFIQDASIVFTKELLDIKEKVDKKQYDSVDMQKSMIKLTTTIQNELPRLKPMITHYITDRQVLSFLIDGVQETVHREYEGFYQYIIETGNKKLIDGLIESDTLTSIWSDIVTDIFTNDNGADEDEIENDNDSLALDLSDDEYINSNNNTALELENGDVSKLDLKE